MGYRGSARASSGSWSPATLAQRASKARGPGKGKEKEKRSREDDIPPEPTTDMTKQLNCLHELQHHYECAAHSKGMRTYCLIRMSDKNQEGGHKAMSHEYMTLWAKKMVSNFLSQLTSVTRNSLFSSQWGRRQNILHQIPNNSTTHQPKNAEP